MGNKSNTSVEVTDPTSRPLSPDELLDDVVKQRGWGSTEPVHAIAAAEARIADIDEQLKNDPNNKQLKRQLKRERATLAKARRRQINLDPSVRTGRDLGHGSLTYAKLQVVDSNGNVVARGIGVNTSDDMHAEDNATEEIRRKIKGRKIRGGHLDVAVDQEVCPRCRARIIRFARELDLNTVDVHHHARPSATGKGGDVSPKTAARTATTGRKIPESTRRTYQLYNQSTLANRPTAGTPEGGSRMTGQSNRQPSRSRKTRSEPKPTKGLVGRAVGAIGFAQDVVGSYQKIKETIEHLETVNKEENILPFIRRVRFWLQFGILPYVQGVDDDADQLSPNYYTDLNAILLGLKGDWLEAFYIRHSPENGIFAITDRQFEIFEKHLNEKVRNYDQYMRYFGAQDAIRWINTRSKYWEDAIWQIRVGYYDTGTGGFGFNKVVERWDEAKRNQGQPIGRLTVIMRRLVNKIIKNTNELLGLLGKGISPAVFNEKHRLGDFTFDSDVLGAGKPILKATVTGNKRRSTVEMIPYYLEEGVPAWKVETTKRDVTWVSPPSFYVYSTSDGKATLLGANYETYYKLRDLTTRAYKGLKSGGGYPSYLILNEHGAVRMPLSELILLQLK